MILKSSQPRTDTKSVWSHIISLVIVPWHLRWLDRNFLSQVLCFECSDMSHMLESFINARRPISSISQCNWLSLRGKRESPSMSACSPLNHTSCLVCMATRSSRWSSIIRIANDLWWTSGDARAIDTCIRHDHIGHGKSNIAMHTRQHTSSHFIKHPSWSWWKRFNLRAIVQPASILVTSDHLNRSIHPHHPNRQVEARHTKVACPILCKSLSDHLTESSSHIISHSNQDFDISFIIGHLECDLSIVDRKQGAIDLNGVETAAGEGGDHVVVEAARRGWD